MFDQVAQFIDQKSPRSFLLENVAALTHVGRKKAFEKMIATLRRSGKYFVTWRVLNARQFGIPQNRPRLFIVGLLRYAGSQAGFAWPKPQQRPPLPLTRFLCGGAGVLRGPPEVGTVAHDQLKMGLAAIREEGGNNPRTTDYSLDIWAGREYPGRMTNRVHCITRKRAGVGGSFVTSVNRLLTVEEMLSLQGLPTSHRAAARRAGISDGSFGQMVGNAIPTNTVKPILARILTWIGKHK